MYDEADYRRECYRRLTGYIERVTKGAEPAGVLEHGAVKRHLDDLVRAEADEDWPYYFDETAPYRVFTHFSRLRHSKGRWARQQFVLEGWQAFIIWVVFGWMRWPSGTRRFDTAYTQVARKNGKSTFLSGIGLYLLRYDGEKGAEIYSAATKKDQAKIVHKEAVRMVRQAPKLKERIVIRGGVTNPSIEYPQDNCTYTALGADADTLDGLNPHGMMVDELHAHKKRDLWDVLNTGSGAREQPLLWAITTSGFDLEGICYEQRDYAQKVVRGVQNDDQYFAFVCEPEPEDDLSAVETMRKANPNLGVSVHIDELRKQLNRARKNPSALNDFLTKRLNRWVAQAELWISPDEYRDLPTNALNLIGQECYAGMDLASTRDLTSVVLAFPPTEDRKIWALLPFFWCPEEMVREASAARNLRYDEWVRTGELNATEGNVTDYDAVREAVNDLQKMYHIREIGYDPHKAPQIATQLTADGFELVEMRQGALTLNAPVDELERLIVSRQINPSSNRVLTWCFNNVAMKENEGGLRKPIKTNRHLKIDGVVAALMAVGRAIAQQQDAATDFTPMRLTR